MYFSLLRSFEYVKRNFWSRLAGKYGVKSYVKEVSLHCYVYST